MNEDEKTKIYNKGFEYGQEHSFPSPETRKFMENTAQQFKEIKDKLSSLVTKKDIKIAVLEANREFFKEADKKYTKKWVEVFFTRSIQVIIIGFIVSVLALIGWRSF